jgi:hypothetical protein
MPQWMYFAATLAFLTLAVPLTTRFMIKGRVPLDIHILWWYLAGSVVIETVAYALGHFKVNNNFIYHFWTLAEFIMFMAILSTWQRDGKSKSLIWQLTALFVVLFLGAKVFWERLDGIDNYISSIEALFIAAVSLYTLHQMVSQNQRELTKDHRFWVIASWLLYYTINLLTYALGKTILSSRPQLWLIVWLSSIVSNMLYAVSFLCYGKYHLENRMETT